MKRRVRKMIDFSKPGKMHGIVIGPGLFINRYAFGVLV